MDEPAHLAASSCNTSLPVNCTVSYLHQWLQAKAKTYITKGGLNLPAAFSLKCTNKLWPHLQHAVLSATSFTSYHLTVCPMQRFVIWIQTAVRLVNGQTGAIDISESSIARTHK